MSNKKCLKQLAMRRPPALKLCECIQVPLKNWRSVFVLPVLGYVVRNQPWSVSTFTYIRMAALVFFFILWVRSFGISPLSPLLTCEGSFCLFLGITSNLQKYPLLPRTLVFCLSFARGRRLKLNAGRKGKSWHQEGSGIHFSLLQWLPANTLCTWLFSSFIHPLFTPVAGSHNFKSRELCIYFMDKGHKKNSES